MGKSNFLIRLGNKVIYLDKITHCVLDPEYTELKIHFDGHTSLHLQGQEAEDMWKLFRSTSLDITRKDNDTDINGTSD